ncbi:MAG TPA: nuclear transport factor 2 family protein [Gemmatimonadales bacterium]|nr:nuclear transport factor 2 family protein [Candidatus Bathyarchaeia archaeon]HUL03476.1 nuclear transport factor 2 family protein [Gemmatimonadales bacterium]
MASSSDNVAKLKAAYREWHATKGVSVKAWLDLMVDDVRCFSLAAGRPEATFTAAINSKKDFERYFKGLLDDWEMIHYTTSHFVVEGDNIAVRGSTGWRNRKTRKVVDTPKADFWTFRDGKVVEFHEYYDTAALVAAATP